VSQQASQPGAPHVAFRDLSVRYGAKQALDRITLDVPRNSIFGIIGPANSGKTTLLKCINRTVDFATGVKLSGQVLVDGDDVLKMRNLYALRRRIGMVFPLPVGLPLSVYDNVAYAPRMAGTTNRAELVTLVETCLRQAALWDEVKDRLEAQATGLSGGQQQRLCIARALANNPEVLLMDEPCSALDPIATQRVEELIVELKAKYTIVIVTHNMQQAARVSDVTGFFYQGELVEFGPTDKMFTTPSQEKTEAYITGRFG
jgi:phosphate transport system ATP-binding protein